MKKVFISIPVSGKKQSEVDKMQNYVLNRVSASIGEPVILLSAWNDYETRPLEYISDCIKRLASADYAVFADEWQDCRTCVIERMCAEEYCEKYNFKIFDL